MNGLAFHTELRDRLLDRSEAERAYVVRLEDALAVSIRDTVISTSEHTAPFNTRSTVSFVLPQLLLNSVNDRKASICILAASLIPLDNADYPRGFLLPGFSKDTARINLFPARLRKASPALLPRARGNLQGIEKLQSCCSSLTATLSKSNAESYAEQISQCMEEMASHWIDSNDATRLKVRPLEEVARNVLLGLLRDNDDCVSQVLFDDATRHAIFQSLKHVYCAWGDRRGSFLFWGAKDHRVFPLWESSGCLENAPYRVPLDCEHVYQELEARRIMPTVFLSFLVVSYLPGLPIAGGPRQLHYYSSMIRVLNDAIGGSRTERLSDFGYNAVDLSSMRTSAIASHSISPFGTGLALAKATLDPGWMTKELEDASLSPSIEDRYE